MRDIDHITIREWLSEAARRAEEGRPRIARKLCGAPHLLPVPHPRGRGQEQPAKLVSTPRLEKNLRTNSSIEDAVRFIETPDVNTDLGKRDRAILEMLYGTGVRVSELVKLDLKDVDFRNKVVRVKGKRRKERVVPFGEPALHALMRYLTEVRPAFLNNAPAAERDEAAVFLNYQGTRITTRSVGRMVDKYIKIAGIHDISPNPCAILATTSSQRATSETFGASATRLSPPHLHPFSWRRSSSSRQGAPEGKSLESDGLKLRDAPLT